MEYTINYHKLMEKVRDGNMEIISWLGMGCCGMWTADVRKYGSRNTTRTLLQVTECPTNLRK